MTGTTASGRVSLPVDEVLPGVVSALRQRPVLVLAAPPGSGKTTRLPPALLDSGLCGDGEIVVLQPRRLAARMAARRVAAERGEAPGGTVGWKVRFESVGGPATRLWYVTEGVLVRRLLADPTLAGVGAVVLDEFHERSLDADLCLALLRRLRAGPRPDLRLVIMSATLDAEGLAATLDATAVRAEGRRFDVAVEHAASPDARPLEARVAQSVERLVAADEGDILVFLPGAAEIRRCRDALADLARRSGRLVLPLHGDLPPEEQDRAVQPGDRPKIILSTNVAETSITVEGVTAVVDSGLARRLVHSPWSGLPSLRVGAVSQASVAQRTGRAGRVGPGRCVRLFTRSDHDGRPAADVPEIARADLADAVLLLRAAGIDPAAGVPWLDPPPRAALDAAEVLLRRLELVGADGCVTDLGVRVAGLPAHPRLGRLVAEAGARGRLAEGCLLAAVLAERDVRRSTGARRMLQSDRTTSAGPASDALSGLPEGFLDPVEAVGLLCAGGRHADLDPVAVTAVRRAASHLESVARRAGLAGGIGSADGGGRDRALTLALLAGFPDRVGRVRRSTLPGLARAGALELALSSGGTAELPADALLPEGRLVIAADASERAGSRALVLQVRSARPLDENDLIEGRFDEVRETTEVRFLPGADRVESVRRLAYDCLVLEDRAFPGAPEAVAAALAIGLRDRPFAALAADREDPDAWLARVAFLRARRPDLGLPSFDAADLDAVRRDACQGCRSLADVRRRGVLDALSSRLDPGQRRALDALAPTSFRLPGGRTLRIDYPAGEPPSAASRLQDFFGLARGPAVLGGGEPVVLHLLTPAGRDVQVTTDLAGFWERHYPALARELRRRYPRHSWPEDPAHATPPPPNRPR
jgi:ATP-dependent helicase HrpB